MMNMSTKQNMESFVKRLGSINSKKLTNEKEGGSNFAQSMGPLSSKP
jgi:hypothetical protein